MNGKFLLDTNAIIHLMDQGGPLGERLRGQQVWVPTIVFGELYFGAYESKRSKENLQRPDQIALAVSVIPCDLGTASIFGKIKQELRTIGKPIPDNDIWIAAMAMQHTLTLVTEDAHFGRIVGLNVVTW